MDSITIKDIAKICGVGVSTISRAINNHPDINPATRRMIMDAIRQYNYIPNNSARNLKRTGAKAIAILVKGLDNPFFSGMIRVMESEIKKRKYTMVLEHVDFEVDEADVALELIKEKRLSGIIFLGGLVNHSDEKLRRLRVPFVLCTSSPDGSEDSEDAPFYSSISVDDEKESYLMTQYLLRLGHRDIAIVAADELDSSIGKRRLDGYRRAMADGGIAVTDDLILYSKKDIDDYTYENGYAVTRELIEKKVRFSAIYAISDVMAFGALRALYEAGIKVPEVCSLAGFDGIELGEYCVPSITTVKQPDREMALSAIELLFDVVMDGASHCHTVFPGELTVRESTRRR